MDYNMLTDEELLRSFIGWPLTKLEETLAARLTACLDSNAELEKASDTAQELHDAELATLNDEIRRLNRESEELSNALSACESRVSDDA